MQQLPDIGDTAKALQHPFADALGGLPTPEHIATSGSAHTPSGTEASGISQSPFAQNADEVHRPPSGPSFTNTVRHLPSSPHWLPVQQLRAEVQLSPSAAHASHRPVVQRAEQQSSGLEHVKPLMRQSDPLSWQ
jgi:hypothetical protein